LNEPRTAVLETRGVSMTFPGVQALKSVDFRLIPGEVHALMGQNGAGKSTLIKVLTGVNRPEAGSILLEGRPIRPQSTSDAEDLGIATVYQEVNLCHNLSVAENIFLGREQRKFGFIDWKEMDRQADMVLRDKLDIAIDVTKELSSYSLAIQQMVAIARALARVSKVLILDEPTSSLDVDEVARLFAVIRKLKEGGMAILFVTHFLDQTYQISDRISVLRNGEFVGEWEKDRLPRLELISKMIGKDYVELETMPKSAGARKDGSKAFLRLKKYGRKGLIRDVDLDIEKGQTLGLAGLLGSGRTEIAKLLFGIEQPDGGDYFLDGKKVRMGSPQAALRRGLGFCPEDRKVEAVIGDFSVRENIVLALQARQGILRALGRKQQNALAEKFIDALGISTPSPEQLLKNLSGGNQQKVILARWLLTEPRLLILDEPTRGIDVRAKAEIQKLIMELCAKGLSILFISSELEEVLRVSGRVAVLRDRRKIAELDGASADENDIFHIIAEGERDGRN
jgi:galactofuranose transport system ATP-binding protein